MKWYYHMNLYSLLILILMILLILILTVLVVTAKSKESSEIQPKKRKRDPHDFYRGELFEDTEPTKITQKESQ